MYEAFHQIGQFSGWTEKARDDRLRELADVAVNCKLKEFVCGVSAQAFKNFDIKSLLPAPANSPYFLGFHKMIRTVAGYLLSVEHKERFEIFFDVHKIFGYRAKKYYPLVQILEKNTPMGAILPIEPIFRDDKETYPLQIADMAAWLVRDKCEGNEHWLLQRFENVELYGDFLGLPELMNIANSEPIELTSEQQYEWQEVIDSLHLDIRD